MLQREPVGRGEDDQERDTFEAGVGHEIVEEDIAHADESHADGEEGHQRHHGLIIALGKHFHDERRNHRQADYGEGAEPEGAQQRKAHDVAFLRTGGAVDEFGEHDGSQGRGKKHDGAAKRAAELIISGVATGAEEVLRRDSVRAENKSADPETGGQRHNAFQPAKGVESRAGHFQQVEVLKDRQREGEPASRKTRRT